MKNLIGLRKALLTRHVAEAETVVVHRVFKKKKWDMVYRVFKKENKNWKKAEAVLERVLVMGLVSVGKGLVRVCNGLVSACNGLVPANSEDPIPPASVWAWKVSFSPPLIHAARCMYMPEGK